MAAIDQGAEVTVRRETWLTATGYFVKRYPLGAIRRRDRHDIRR